MTEKENSYGSLVLSLPLPPTVNQSYKSYPVGKKGMRTTCRMVLDKNAKAYKEMARMLAAAEWRRLEPFPITDSTRFTLELLMLLRKNSRDVDANIKLVMDGVMMGVKDATGLDGLSDIRVFDAVLRKRLLREEQKCEGMEPQLIVTLTEWKLSR